MKDYLILRVTAKFIIPFIIMFALYVQMHGEFSPGGGFQAGVILAAAFILHSLCYGLETATKIVSVETLKIFACLGVLLYAAVGLLAMHNGGNFLGYSYLAKIPTDGQKWGIFFIELGVGLTVFSVMLLMYFTFAGRDSDSD